jgi:Fe-S-cluster containining protein
LKKTLLQYQRLLETIDQWFTDCQSISKSEISCRRSCTGCCRGLFDISLLDAGLLQHGFSLLDEAQRQPIITKAEARLAALQHQWPELKAPYILNNLPDSQWQEMPEEDETPCPLLSDDGLCLVYKFRPMTCRLHGLPNIDISGESFSDEFCSLNFRQTDPLNKLELRWKFRDTFNKEFDLLAQFSQQLTGTRRLELDTFIPLALLIDFDETDWQKLPKSTR